MDAFGDNYTKSIATIDTVHFFTIYSVQPRTVIRPRWIELHLLKEIKHLKMHANYDKPMNQHTERAYLADTIVFAANMYKISMGHIEKA